MSSPESAIRKTYVFAIEAISREKAEEWAIYLFRKLWDFHDKGFFSATRTDFPLCQIDHPYSKNDTNRWSIHCVGLGDLEDKAADRMMREIITRAATDLGLTLDEFLDSIAPYPRSPNDIPNLKLLLQDKCESLTRNVLCLLPQSERDGRGFDRPPRKQVFVASPPVGLVPADENNWRVSFKGRDYFFSDVVGFHYIAELMRQPGIEISATVLQTQVRPAGLPVPEKDALKDALQAGLVPDSHCEDRDGDVAMDDRAVREFKDRLTNLRVFKIRAEESNDFETASQHQAEIEEILQHIRKNTNEVGNPRKIGSRNENARTAVTNAITRAIDTIERANPEAGQWLRKRIKTGGSCRFTPQL